MKNEIYPTNIVIDTGSKLYLITFREHIKEFVVCSPRLITNYVDPASDGPVAGIAGLGNSYREAFNTMLDRIQSFYSLDLDKELLTAKFEKWYNEIKNG